MYISNNLKVMRMAEAELKAPKPKAPKAETELAKPSVRSAVPQLISGRNAIQTTDAASYSKGKIKTNIEQADDLYINAAHGVMVNGNEKSVTIFAPYARIRTSSSGDFHAGKGEATSELYIGTVDVKNLDDSVIDSYDKAIVLKNTVTSDRCVLLPLNRANLTFEGGVPLEVRLEVSNDHTIPAMEGPKINGKRQDVKIFAPYTTLIDADPNKGFSVPGASFPEYYFGAMQVGQKHYENAIAMRESLSSPNYIVVEVK